MTDQDEKNNQQQGGDSSDSDQQTDNTSDNFEFTDSSFKRGQNISDLQKRATNTPQKTTPEKKTDS